MIRPASLLEIQKNLELLLTEGDVVELRIFDKNGKKYCGWFDDRRKMAEAALSHDGTAEGIYYSSNGCDSKMLAVANNRTGKCIGASKETDIIRRRLFGIDVDPVRDAGISSTDAEKALALIRVKEVSDWLSTLGFPEPVLGDSGNGYHNDYFVDLPNTPEIKQIYTDAIKAIQARFPKDTVDVQGFADANRIWKVYGTVARKGDATPDRPYRRSQILSVPAKKAYVSLEILTMLASLAPKEQQKPEPLVSQPRSTIQSTSSSDCKPWTPEDLKRWLMRHGGSIFRTKSEGGTTHFVLDTCLNNSAHTGHHEADVRINSSGVIAYKCHHNSCAGVTWRDVRMKLDKEYAESQRKHAEWVQRQNSSPVINQQEQKSGQSDKPKKTKDRWCLGFINAMKGVHGMNRGKVAVAYVRALRFWQQASVEQTIKSVKKYCKACQPPLDFTAIEPQIIDYFDTPIPPMPICGVMIATGLCEDANCKPMVNNRLDRGRIALLALQERYEAQQKEKPSPAPTPISSDVPASPIIVPAEVPLSSTHKNLPDDPPVSSVTDDSRQRIVSSVKTWQVAKAKPITKDTLPDVLAWVFNDTGISTSIVRQHIIVNKTIKLLKDIPNFVGIDGVLYILKANTIVTLPELHAKGLIKRNGAVEV